jgi:hypothetical protein
MFELPTGALEMESNSHKEGLAQQKRARLIQEVQGMGADALLKVNEEELCVRLATKYQYELANGTGTVSEVRLIEIVRKHVTLRKANLFSA